MSARRAVTVLLAVHNGERYLGAALDSLLAQSFGDFELVVVDDGSTDRTREIIAGYRDGRIRVVRNASNLGLARSLNRGLREATAELIVRQDADDLSEPHRLARQVAWMRDRGDVALAGSWYIGIDAAGLVRDHRRLPTDDLGLRWAMLFYCPFVHSAVIFRRGPVLERTGGYDERFAYAMDFDLWTRIARHFRVANVPDYLVRLREHPTSMTATYGVATQEGTRVRTAAVAALLGWPSDDPAGNAARYERLVAWYVWPPEPVDSGAWPASATELLHLERAFSAAHALPVRDAAAHRQRVREHVARRLVEGATRAARRGARRDARCLLAAAPRFHPAIVLAPRFARAGARILLGASR